METRPTTIQECFTSTNYGVMRHAELKSGEHEFNTYTIQILEGVAQEFSEKIKGKDVVIYHSPVFRAELTAKVFRNRLESKGLIITDCSSLGWLALNQNELSNKRVQGVMRPSEKTFYLFISHEPDIESFLYHLDSLANCTILAKEFVISGNR